MSKKILIVDDSETTRMKIKSFLNEDFCSVEAENGAVALEVLEKDHSFDLIILDINMPEIDGMTFIKIQKDNEKINKIPTILCTTEASTKLKEEAKTTGVVKAWLIKPVIKLVLLKAIERVLSKYKIDFFFFFFTDTMFITIFT